MKSLKKMMALVIAMVMVLAISIPAMAATITINQPTPTDGTAGAETYVAYKIFDVTKTSSVTEDVTTDSTLGAGTATGFAYTISTSNAWYSVVNGMTDYFTLTQSAGDSTVYNVTLKDGKNTADDAKAIAEYLQAHIPTSVECNPSATGYDATAAGTATTKKYTFTSNGTTATVTVDDGYYMITSTLGTNLVAATSNITINTKNEYITDEKTVAKTDWNVGDKVPYTIVVNLPASVDYTKPVIVHDTMDNVLNLITATTGDYAWSATEGENDFTSHVTLATGKSNGHDDSGHEIGANQVGYDFTLDISSLAPAANADPVAKTITITYYAELLSTAAADHGYVNKEFVEYSKYKTTPNDVTVKTYDFDLEKKFTGAASTENLVATFNLYGMKFTADANGTYYKLKSGAYTTTAPVTTGEEADQTGHLYDSTTTKYKGEKADAPLDLVEETIYEKYVKADSDDTTKTSTISAKLGTTLNVRGLAEGTYYLTELTTADGYNKLTEDIVIVIDAEGNATVSGASDLFSASNNKITVVNNSGSVLPSTGGIGTTIFYIVGAILVLGAGILLVTRRRMNAN